MTLVRVTLTEDAPSSGFPFELPAIRALPLDVHGNVTVIVGDNGTGKSTLIEAVAVAAGFNPEGGSGQVRFETTPTHSGLGEHLRLVWTGRLEPGWFLRAESFYNVASFRQANPGGDERSYHEMSHGESFLDVARSWFANRQLFILDEPEAALSFTGQLSLIAGILAGVEVGAQFIIATHSPVLMSIPGAQLFELDELGVSNRAYDELEVVAQWRSFLDAPDRFLRYLR